ncbi:conserved repeat domain-containing protein [Frankineae bacterium MT45]|nr:conserved repeat domain-containing protein [Frankineae bacterium MT45]
MPTTRSRRSRLKRWISGGTVSAIAALGLLAMPQTAAAAAAPITLSKSGPGTVVEGDTATYTFTATNPSAGAGGVNQFNLSFTDVLVPGTTYVGGSTTPAQEGDPTISTDPATGAQTLTWVNLFDLAPAGSVSFSFSVNVDNTVWPVDSTFTDTGTAYASSDPRVIPSFTNGAVTPDPAVTASAPSTAATTVSAIEVTKNEPSPEGKLLRGVHDHPTVYTLQVTNSKRATSDNVAVTDYLPASLEFLGCGGVDNSTTGPEYLGSGSLAATPVVPTDCPTPASVETVSAPAGYPPGVYTKVTWNVGVLAANQVLTIRYAAGIPLQQNTTDFTGTTPTPTSLGQTANLDNNNGPSTRQNGTAVGLTNYVNVTGDYDGTVAPGGTPAIDITRSHTVTANDLRVIKSVQPTQFVSGGLATYTLQIDASEYANSSIVVTDTMPNGLCPLDTTKNYVTGAPADCNPGSVAPSVPYQSVTQNADGTFTVVFDPIAVNHNGTTTITYQARMRSVFTGGAVAGQPTVAGDAFTNTVSETAITTPIPATPESGQATITDNSSATLASGGGVLIKQIQPRTAVQDCAANSYIDSDAPTAPTTFMKGDRICFQIELDYSATNPTRNSIVSDILPLDLAYEAGSFVVGPGNTLPAGQINFTSGTDEVTWQLGADQPDGSKVVAPGSVFVARFSAIVTAAAPGTALLATHNDVKARANNTAGDAGARRASAYFNIAPAAAVGITKGVASVNGAAAGAGGPNVDHVLVREGDQVVFRVDVTNNSPTSEPGGGAIQSVNAWDVLPAGITCTQISAITDGGVCTNPGAAGQPTFADSATRSAIVWKRPATEILAPGTSATYNYTMTVPTGIGADQDLVNTAYLRSYDAVTNVPGSTSTYYPQSNIDTSVPVPAQEAPPASDPSDVYLAPVVETKSVVSAVNEAGNIGAEAAPGGASTQATIGELVTFTIDSDVPARSTVYNGVISDALPAGLALVSATAAYSPDAANVPANQALPGGVAFDAATATLTLPATYGNTTDTAQRFAITLVARVTNDPGNTAGVTRTNTSTFSSAAPPGGSDPADVKASANVVIVEPTPNITKSANPANVIGGQTVTYTLTASNGGSGSVLHDGWVVDCLPVGVTFVAYGTVGQGTTVPATTGDGTNCASGTTQIEWNVGDLAPGASTQLTYTGTVTADATGLQKFTNTATITANSLAGARPTPANPGDPNGRPYSKSTTSTITVLGADVVKTVTPTVATIGQTVTYTVTAVASPNISYFNATLLDTLPPGIDGSSVQLQTFQCASSDGTPCNISSATPLTSVPQSNGSTKIGFYLGDVIGAPRVRAVTLTYTAKVADVAAAKAGASLQNTAGIAWNNTAKAPPTDAGATFDQQPHVASAPVTVIEPSMAISKTVSDTTVEPRQSVDYSVTARNATGTFVSDAYNVKVVDTIPAGVVVTPATISGGGVLSGTTAGAGGNITWTVPGPLAPGASTAFTYSAVLAPSATLTTAAQVNSATVTSYASLPTGGRVYPATTPATASITPTFPHVVATKTTPGGTLAYLGEPFNWQVTITNNGGGTAYHVTAADLLPPNWTYDNDSARVSVNGGAATPVEPALSGDPQTLTWSDLGTLAPGGSLTINYAAIPGDDVVTNPGIGLSVNDVNQATPGAQDATGATGNKSGSYGGPSVNAVAHIASADVTMTKTAGPNPVAGQSGSWTLVVKNVGPDTAVGPFTVTDPFDSPPPAGVSAVTATGTGWTCSATPPAGCVRTDPSETLAVGASFPPITVGYHVAASVADGTEFTNSATVTNRTYDPQLVNNTDVATTTVTASADLAISKTLSGSGIVPGTPATYNIAVTNLGPSQSAGPFVITDTLPAGSTFVSATGIGWNCDPITPGTVGATLTCTHPTSLPVGISTRGISVTVGIPANQTAAVTNTARISSTTTTDPNPANDTATVTTPVSPLDDLTIQKSHNGTFVDGTDQSYTLTVANFGPSDAADATITDLLPAGLTFLPSGNADWTCSAAGQRVTCLHSAPLAAHATSSVTLNVHVYAAAVLPIINLATVSGTTPDSNPTNNADDDNTDITREADLAIDKHHTGSATAGAPFSYLLTVTNNGPSTIPGTVTVSDPIPSGMTYDSANPATGAGWVCSYGAVTKVVTCTLAAGLAAGATAPDITVNVIVDHANGSGTIVNTASVRSDTDDTDLSNNSDDDPTTIVVDTNVSLTKTLDTPTPVLAGTDVTFTLQASNAGPSDARVVVVTDVLPDHLSYVSATGAGWACLARGQNVICTRAVLAANPPGPVVAPITLVAQVDPSTPFDPPGSTTVLVNTATVNTVSPGTIVNPPPVPVPVVAQANLALTKTPSTASPVAGTTFRWTFSAKNNGPSDAAGPLTITDTLPAYESYVANLSGWTCTPGPAPATPTDRQDVTCTLASGLAVGATAPSLVLLVRLDASSPAGTVQNVADVSSPTPDANGAPSHATGTGTIDVHRVAGLTIDKSHSGKGVVGEPMDFLIQVHNNGPSDADEIVVTDPLPAGLTYVSGVGTGWTCIGPRNNVVCTLAGILPSGADAPPLTITTTVGAAAYQQTTNIATVSSIDRDVPGSARDDDTLIVEPDADLGLTKRHTNDFVSGSTGTYQLVVSNNGPTAEPGPIVLTDPLPAGLTYVSATGAGWVCSVAGSKVTCKHAGPLAVGATSTILLTVRIGDAAIPSVLNTATVSGPGSPDASADDRAPVSGAAVDAASTGDSGGSLAATGDPVLAQLLLALMLLGLGTLAVWSSRRRTS